MNQFGFWKKLLPGFIPIIVFIIADEFWGTIPGLIVAIASGCLQLFWIGFKEKRFDTFILFDTILLVALGGISILLENDLFFKLKPGLIGVIFLLILGVSAFSSFDVVGIMTRRYLKEISITREQAVEMRKNLKILFWIVLFQTLLVFYSAYFMSKEAWAFISGGLLYIFFAIFFVFQWFKMRRKKKELAKEEWLPLVDEEGRVTGKAPRTLVHNGSKLLHPVVHLHVVNLQRCVLLQKRPASKDIQPGKWDTAVGGHISAGETLETALKRETAEEIGLLDFSARFVRNYHWESEAENELVYMFVTYDHKGVSVQSDEVDELRFWTRHEVEKNLGKNVFTPNFEHDFQVLKSLKLI
jgi:isopentenyldiphosphate isomerase/intracellular septation protein A